VDLEATMVQVKEVLMATAVGKLLVEQGVVMGKLLFCPP